ncbi:MAG: hypothetical protein C0410_14530 [Anaerolinea sp.]|nr:hypothetical protein [Anaerolinea sp.]
MIFGKLIDLNHLDKVFTNLVKVVNYSIIEQMILNYILLHFRSKSYLRFMILELFVMKSSLRKG